MNKEQQRKEFEEWATSNESIGLDLDMDIDDGVEHYWNHSTYTAWEAWQAAREQVTEQRDGLQKIIDEQCRVSSVCRKYREQRDRLAGEIVGWRNKWECAVEMAAQAEVKRDRLIESMTRIKNIYENPGKWCIPSSSDMYDEAIESLESLTTKTSTD